MASTATGLVLIAGTATFATEWYNTGKVNFKVPIATLLAAAVFDGLAKLDDKAAVGLSVLVLLGALTTKWGGRSAVETVAAVFTEQTEKKKQPSTTKKAA
jgi:PPE-repeat protein